MSDTLAPAEPAPLVEAPAEDPMVALREKKKAMVSGLVAATNFDETEAPESPVAEPEPIPAPEPELEHKTAPEATETPVEEPDEDIEVEFNLDSHSESNQLEEATEQQEQPAPKKEGFDLRRELSKAKGELKEKEESYAAKEEELARMQAELDSYKTENDKLSTTAQTPESHPTFIKGYEDYTKSIDDKLTSKGLWNALNLSTNDKVTMAAEAAGISSLPVNQRQGAHEALRLTFAKRLGLIDPTETDFSIDPEAEEKANSIVNVFAEVSGGYKELVKLRDDLAERIESKTIELGYEEREQAAAPTRKRISSLIEMDAALIEDDPHSLMSVASGILKDDKMLSRGVKTTIENYRFGRRQLSQQEITTITESGKDLKEHIETMERKVEKDSESLDGFFAACLALKPEIEKAIRSNSKSKSKNEAKKKTESTMRELTKPKIKPVPPKAEAPLTLESLEEKKKAYQKQVFGQVVGSS